MKKYIGVKEIAAKPMTRKDYNDYRGWEMPENEDGTDKGYLVEYLDGGPPNHPNHENYISWSPKGVFEDAYRETEGMTFGLAIEAMRRGHNVARSGWNGKGIFIFIVKTAIGHPQQRKTGMKVSVDIATHIAIDTTGLLTDNPDAPKSVVPWLASQTDILAEDWQIV